MAKKGKGGRTAYRGGEARGGESREREGLAFDIVRQFSDRYAFYRELVQNAIDAGATRIVVRVVHDPDERTARISVNDDGSGMTQSVLEEDLTVLFKSTKESRDDAIGKFGIGFVSVLAIEPQVVVVDTSTGDGVRHRLDLFSDHTFELSRASGGERGTTVTLHVPTEAEALPHLIERSRHALDRWCRHAQVPITFLVHGREPERIDRPLALEGTLVHVAGRSRDRATELVVGLHPEAATGAFYNRGLLLYETAERFPGIGAVAFKAVDGKLEHTLSRDDVRRDAHFSTVLERIARAVRGPLTDRVHEASGELDLPGWRVLFDAALRADLALDPQRLFVPLVVPIDGERAWPLARFPLLRCLPASRELAEALAASKIPVAALSFTNEAPRIAALQRLSGREPVAADTRDGLIAAVDEGPFGPIWAPLEELLGNAIRKPSRIGVARLGGALTWWLAIGFPLEDQGTHTGSVADLSSDPFRRLARPPLILNVEHPVMQAARRALLRGAEPRTVAALLARGILTARALSTPASRAAITETAIRRALEEAP